MPVFTTKEEYFYAECLPITIYREGEPFAVVIGDGTPGEPATETDIARAAQIRDALAASEPTVGSFHGASIAEQVRLATSLIGTHDQGGRQELRDVIAYLGRRASAEQNALNSLAIVAGEIVYGDGTDASQQRAIDSAVAALEVHGITREVWAQVLAGEPPKPDPLLENAGKLLEFVREIAQRNPVFAKGWEKGHIADAKALVAAAEGRMIADRPADCEQRGDGGLVAFIPISSAARQWSIDAGPKNARWEHGRWYATCADASAARREIEAEGFTVREV